MRLQSFPGLPHRSAWVADIAGVRYIDDSKGTNVGATFAAVAGMHGPAGDDRRRRRQGPGFHAAGARPFAARCAHAVLIGKDAPAHRAALDGVCRPSSAALAWRRPCAPAQRAAQPGDTVLLSPACASLDMFRDYDHRGDVFAAAVHELDGGAP